MLVLFSRNIIDENITSSYEEYYKLRSPQCSWSYRWNFIVDHSYSVSLSLSLSMRVYVYMQETRYTRCFIGFRSPVMFQYDVCGSLIRICDRDTGKRTQTVRIILIVAFEVLLSDLPVDLITRFILAQVPVLPGPDLDCGRFISRITKDSSRRQLIRQFTILKGRSS